MSRAEVLAAVSAALDTVLESTGDGATLRELDLALMGAGHEIPLEVTSAVLGDLMDTAEVRAARDDTGDMVRRDGQVLWIRTVAVAPAIGSIR